MNIEKRSDSPVMAVLFVIALGLCAGSVFLRAEEADKLPPASKKKIGFVRDVKPLFKDHCIKCHGPSKSEGGLRLDRRDDALNGGDSGPFFVSGKSAESKLIKLTAAVDPDVVMPPEGDRLTDEQIGILRAWIDQGANWPKDE